MVEPSLGTNIARIEEDEPIHIGPAHMAPVGVHEVRRAVGVVATALLERAGGAGNGPDAGIVGQRIIPVRDAGAVA